MEILKAVKIATSIPIVSGEARVFFNKAGYIESFNGFIGFRIETEGIDFDFCCDGKILRDVINKGFTSPKIFIKKDKLVFSEGKRRVSLPFFEDTSRFPEINVDNLEFVAVDKPNDFFEAISLVLPFCGNEALLGSFASAILFVDQDTVIGTDKHKLLVHKTDLSFFKAFDCDVLNIPTLSLKNLLMMSELEETLDLSVTDSGLFISRDDVLFFSTLLSEKTEQSVFDMIAGDLFKKEKLDSLVKIPLSASFLSAINASKQFKQQYNNVFLKIKATKMTLYSENTIGNFSEDFELPENIVFPNEIEVSFNPDFFDIAAQEFAFFSVSSKEIHFFAKGSETLGLLCLVSDSSGNVNAEQTEEKTQEENEDFEESEEIEENQFSQKDLNLKDDE